MTSLFGKSKKKGNNNNDNNKRKHIDDLISTEIDDTKETKNTNNNNKDDDNDENSIGSSSSNSSSSSSAAPPPLISSFGELGLDDTLIGSCRSMGFKQPTRVQQIMIPYLLSPPKKENILCLSSTGSGKTAAFCLPILHRLSHDPYGVYATILTPTRELAKQIHQQIVAFSGRSNVESALIVGGMDSVAQSCKLQHSQPHFVVATPGRLATLLRGPPPHPRLQYVRYLVLDEADRLLTPNSGFQDDVILIQQHIKSNQKKKKDMFCQTLLFSATMTQSLSNMEQLASNSGNNNHQERLLLKKFVIRTSKEEEEKKKFLLKSKKVKNDGSSDDDNSSSDEDDNAAVVTTKLNTLLTPTLPAGLKQEYIFMPSRVRDAYLVTIIRNLVQNGGRRRKSRTPNNKKRQRIEDTIRMQTEDDDDEEQLSKARLAIIFVSSCRRAAFVSLLFTQLGVDNVPLHSLLNQRRRLASVAKFQSHHTRLLVATDVASRGLDIPHVDLVINADLPRRIDNYVHRVGRTARAGRRGTAISLVGETDISLVQAIESNIQSKLSLCKSITDDMALKLLGPVTKATRLANKKLMDIGFDELEQKMKRRKLQDRIHRQQLK